MLGIGALVAKSPLAVTFLEIGNKDLFLELDKKDRERRRSDEKKPFTCKTKIFVEIVPVYARSGVKDYVFVDAVIKRKNYSKSIKEIGFLDKNKGIRIESLKEIVSRKCYEHMMRFGAHTIAAVDRTEDSTRLLIVSESYRGCLEEPRVCVAIAER